jgi:carboxylesterase type B
MLPALLTLAVFSALLGTVSADGSRGAPTVQTANGPVTGYVNSADGVYSFKGIPYAEPPIGRNRLTPAAPLRSNWTTPLNATAFSAGCWVRVCSAFNMSVPYICPAIQSEDCLYANVWTPSLAGTAQPLLPVLVFIHGGGFEFGSASASVFDGANLAGAQSVIVVTFNYRLGALGGLYLGAASSIRGNYQLSDQLQALRWVQANIAAFGGDPTRVTVSGESAGASSVMTLMICPDAAGLFHAAIADSHAFTFSMLEPAEITNVSRRLVAAAGCALEQSSTAELDACVRHNLTAQDIMTPLVTSPKADFWPDGLFELLPPPFKAPFNLVWSPVRHTPLVPGDILEQIRSGQFHHVPTLLGNVANETALFVLTEPLPADRLERSIWTKFGENHAIVDGIRTLYGAPKNTSDARLYLARLSTDYLMLCSGRRGAQELTLQNVPVAVYVFDFFFPLQSTFCEAENVCHGSDLGPLFGVLPATASPSSHAASRTLQSVWGSFARNASSVGHVGSPLTPFDLVGQRRTNASVTSSILTAFREPFCDFFDVIGYNY